MESRAEVLQASVAGKRGGARRCAQSGTDTCFEGCTLRYEDHGISRAIGLLTHTAHNTTQAKKSRPTASRKLARTPREGLGAREGASAFFCWASESRGLAFFFLTQERFFFAFRRFGWATSSHDPCSDRGPSCKVQHSRRLEGSTASLQEAVWAKEAAVQGFPPNCIA